MTRPWSDADVRAALDLPAGDGEGGPNAHFTGVSTDTRTLDRGQLFVALRGERFDGHAHLEAAARAGASGAVVDRTDQHHHPNELALYAVQDTLTALGRLARFKRRSMAARVVGITGSSGKTTTKNLLTGAVGASLKTHATPGNFNNRIGLPLTVFQAPEDAEVLVLEMGTNEPGEIRALADIAEPDMAVVTTVSETHLEGLGSVEGVLEEKLALVHALPTHAPAFVGDTPPVLATRARAGRGSVRVAGLTERADDDLKPEGLTLHGLGCFSFTWRGQPVVLRIPGEGPVTDALLALGVAEALGVSADSAARGVSAVGAGDMRGEVRTVRGRTLLVDCYNANPESVPAAARTLKSMVGDRRIAVLGSMLELGLASQELHRRVLMEVLGLDLDVVVVLGAFSDAAATLSDGRLVALAGVEEAADFLASDSRPGDAILLKASRGVRLERALDGLSGQTGEGD